VAWSRYLPEESKDSYRESVRIDDAQAGHLKSGPIVRKAFKVKFL
jgi:hypothetical protein